MSGMSLYMELEQTCDRLEAVIAERDTARGVAVRLEQENAYLREVLVSLRKTATPPGICQMTSALLDKIIVRTGAAA